MVELYLGMSMCVSILAGIVAFIAVVCMFGEYHMTEKRFWARVSLMSAAVALGGSLLWPVVALGLFLYAAYRVFEYAFIKGDDDNV